MKTRFVALTLILFIFLTNSTILLAQQTDNAKGDWAAVQAVPAGEKLNLRLKDGKKAEGNLQSVSATTLTLSKDNKTTDFSRDAIAKVYRVIQKSRGKSIAKGALIGAGIGFAGGAGVGLAAGQYEDLGTAELVGIFGLLGAGIGAGIGAVASSFGKKQKLVLIYES